MIPVYAGVGLLKTRITCRMVGLRCGHVYEVDSIKFLFGEYSRRFYNEYVETECKKLKGHRVNFEGMDARVKSVDEIEKNVPTHFICCGNCNIQFKMERIEFGSDSF